jgi:hypothetical protein
VGQRVTGTIVNPIYVYDRIVVPARLDVPLDFGTVPFVERAPDGAMPLPGSIATGKKRGR